MDNLTLDSPATLDLLVTNTQPWPITILTIVVVPEDASSTCPAAGNIRVDDYNSSTPGATSYRIAGHQAVSLARSVVAVKDPTRGQDACKNVRFRLNYHGTATTG